MTHRILNAEGIYALKQSKELISKNSKHTILQTIYGPVDSDIKAFNTVLKRLYSSSLKSNEIFYAFGNFKLSIRNYNKNEKVTKFRNLIFEYDFVPVINKYLQILT